MTDRLDRCQVGGWKRILDAMLAFEEGAAEIALVVDHDGCLLGTLTDGDVRRALLAGATLEAPLEPWIQREFVWVPPTAGRTEVIDLMRARTINQIPVLADGGRLVGLHLLHDFVGGVERPNCAVVMAGGRGTRLAPMTETVPKPMIKVAGRPILERIVLHLVGHGIRKVYLSINYLGDLVADHFGDGKRFGCEIAYLRESRPLGTGGALSLLSPPPGHPVVVMNGDLVTQANIGAILDFHENGEQSATMGVRPYLARVPFGCVELDGDRVISIEEKPTVTRLVNAGIYVIDPAVVASVPHDQEIDLPSVLEGCVERGDSVRAFEIEDDWVDVGEFEHLRRALGAPE